METDAEACGMVDGNVIDRARTGDSAAWRTLVDEHLGTVYAVCRSFGLHSRAAEQVNQAVWLRLAEHLRRIRTPGAVGGWIAATTRRECLAPGRSGDRSGWITGGLTVWLGDGANVEQAIGAVALDRSFARLGASCQRLLRLGAARPCPSPEVVGAALDVAADEVVEACAGCRRRLEALVRSDLGATSPADVHGALEWVMAVGDPVPESWSAAAEAAFRWLCIDAEPAEVVYDSTVAAGDEFGDRHGGVARRALRFASATRRVDVVIDIRSGHGDEAEVALSGRIGSAGGGNGSCPSGTGEPAIVARWPEGAVPASVGADGAFHLRDLPFGPLCVEVAGDEPAVAALKTGWIFP